MSDRSTQGGDGSQAVLRFRGVDLDRPPAAPSPAVTSVLRSVSWEVHRGEHWALLGPNGSGKTTMVQLASGYLHPTRGSVEVLGKRLGRTDVRELRRLVALVSASVARKVHPSLPALDVVLSGHRGALEPWWHSYGRAEREQARSLLLRAGFAHVSDRPFAHLSEGERQQVLIARALMCSPGLMLLDEPCAGLDMGGRERLLAHLGSLAALPSSPPLVMVTHHVEEIPAGFTHVLLLRDGRIRAAGPLGSTLTAEHLSDCFDLPLDLVQRDGRWTSRMTSPNGKRTPGPVTAVGSGRSP